MYHNKYSITINKEAADVVALFNAEIAKDIGQHGFNLIDVFTFTVGQDGFSNSQFHIDNRHLVAKAVSEIEKQLSN